MRYVAAYCLAALGNKNPSVKEIENILKSVGIDCDDEKAQAVVSELEGKKLTELFSKGKQKLGSVPAGGGAAAGGASQAAPAAAAAETKKAPEKEPEPEEESDDDMGFGLFD